MRSPIFIVGFPRSGTTLLRALLDAHTGICMVNEPSIIGKLCQSGFHATDWLTLDQRRRFLDELQTDAKWKSRRAALLAESLTALLAPADLSYQEVYERLVPVPETTGVWGEKSLENMFYAADLAKIYPHALFIHIYRDPRSALLSVYRKRFCHAEEKDPPREKSLMGFFAFQSLLWTRWIETADRIVDSAGKDSLIEVKFCDLIEQPEATVTRICQAIGVPFEPTMLDASARSHDAVLASEDAYAHRRLSHPIESDRANAGREMPHWAAYIVERTAGPFLDRFGFERWARPSLFDRALVELALATHRFMLKSRLEREIRAYYGEKSR